MTAGAGHPALELRGVSIGYGRAPVVHEASFSVAADEGLVLLGPSGSGKTSLLYAVAGFIEPMAGEILLGGAVVAGPGRSVPPEARRVGFVFQHAALWPHLSALETVAYPFLRAGAGGAEARGAAAVLLDRLEIGHLAARRPAELSGGEQQRVGLARALARAPDLFLLDEPTAHLDTALKAALQSELARARRPGIATVYATHDVAEAMAVADRVALLRDGRIVQLGTPVQIYQEPIDHWAAELTGPASVLAGRLVERAEGGATIQVGDRAVRVACAPKAAWAAADGRLLVRPDWARLDGDLPGRVVGVQYRGTHTDYRLETAAGVLEIRDAGAPRLAVGALTGWELLRVWPLAGPG